MVEPELPSMQSGSRSENTSQNRNRQRRRASTSGHQTRRRSRSNARQPNVLQQSITSPEGTNERSSEVQKQPITNSQRRRASQSGAVSTSTPNQVKVEKSKETIPNTTNNQPNQKASDSSVLSNDQALKLSDQSQSKSRSSRHRRRRSSVKPSLFTPSSNESINTPLIQDEKTSVNVNTALASSPAQTLSSLPSQTGDAPFPKTQTHTLGSIPEPHVVSFEPVHTTHIFPMPDLPKFSQVDGDEANSACSTGFRTQSDSASPARSSTSVATSVSVVGSTPVPRPPSGPRPITSSGQNNNLLAATSTSSVSASASASPSVRPIQVRRASIHSTPVPMQVDISSSKPIQEKKTVPDTTQSSFSSFSDSQKPTSDSDVKPSQLPIAASQPASPLPNPARVSASRLRRASLTTGATSLGSGSYLEQLEALRKQRQDGANNSLAVANPDEKPDIPKFDTQAQVEQSNPLDSKTTGSASDLTTKDANIPSTPNTANTANTSTLQISDPDQSMSGTVTTTVASPAPPVSSLRARRLSAMSTSSTVEGASPQGYLASLSTLRKQRGSLPISYAPQPSQLDADASEVMSEISVQSASTDVPEPIGSKAFVSRYRRSSLPLTASRLGGTSGNPPTQHNTSCNVIKEVNSSDFEGSVDSVQRKPNFGVTTDSNVVVGLVGTYSSPNSDSITHNWGTNEQSDSDASETGSVEINVVAAERLQEQEIVFSTLPRENKSGLAEGHFKGSGTKVATWNALALHSTDAPVFPIRFEFNSVPTQKVKYFSKNAYQNPSSGIIGFLSTVYPPDLLAVTIDKTKEQIRRLPVFRNAAAMEHSDSHGWSSLVSITSSPAPGFKYLSGPLTFALDPHVESRFTCLEPSAPGEDPSISVLLRNFEISPTEYTISRPPGMPALSSWVLEAAPITYTSAEPSPSSRWKLIRGAQFQSQLLPHSDDCHFSPQFQQDNDNDSFGDFSHRNFTGGSISNAMYSSDLGGSKHLLPPNCLVCATHLSPDLKVCRGAWQTISSYENYNWVAEAPRGIAEINDLRRFPTKIPQGSQTFSLFRLRMTGPNNLSTMELGCSGFDIFGTASPIPLPSLSRLPGKQSNMSPFVEQDWEPRKGSPTTNVNSVMSKTPFAYVPNNTRVKCKDKQNSTRKQIKFSPLVQVAYRVSDIDMNNEVVEV